MLRQSKEIRLRRRLAAEMKDGLGEYEDFREAAENRRQQHGRRPPARYLFRISRFQDDAVEEAY